MKILITGIGISGKSTLRRKMFNTLKNIGAEVKHFDADKFEELRNYLDIYCLKNLPTDFSNDVIYIIEDIHATMTSAVMPIEKYDLILYLRTSIISQILFWFPRMRRWFLSGNYSWEAETGWEGNNRPHSLLNLPGILKNLCRDVKNRKKWIREDLEKIKNHPQVIIIDVGWSKNGPKFKTSF